jgi:hypothetical protein
MNPDWNSVVRRLRSYSKKVHRLLPPCPEERLQTVQADLGYMPVALVEMLRHFNGAKLFNRCGPLVSIFGISTIPLLPALEWCPDWTIDKFTPTWRCAAPRREGHWAIAMLNYGGLIILHDDGSVKQWDTSRGIWEESGWNFDQWVQDILREGDAFMKEE